MFGRSRNERAQRHADTAEGYASMVNHDQDLTADERRVGSRVSATAARRAERLSPGITSRRQLLREVEEFRSGR